MVVACSTTGFTRMPLHSALRAIRELGFDAIDLLAIEGWAHVMPSDLVRDYDVTLSIVRKLLRRYNLMPVAVNTAVRPLTHDRSPQACAVREAQTRALVRMMQDLSISVATLGPRQVDRTRPLPDVIQDSAASLREIMAIAQPAGITLALECHSGSVAETVAASLELMSLVPGLVIAYDPSHMVMQGIDLRETLSLIDRAGQVHLRDAALSQMQVPYGQGLTDFDWLLETLKERGYGGHISVEYLDDGKNDVSQDILAMRAKLAKHGWR